MPSPGQEINGKEFVYLQYSTIKQQHQDILEDKRPSCARLCVHVHVTSTGTQTHTLQKA